MIVAVVFMIFACMLFHFACFFEIGHPIFGPEYRRPFFRRKLLKHRK